MIKRKKEERWFKTPEEFRQEKLGFLKIILKPFILLTGWVVIDYLEKKRYLPSEVAGTLLLILITGSFIALAIELTPKPELVRGLP